MRFQKLLLRYNIWSLSRWRKIVNNYAITLFKLIYLATVMVVTLIYYHTTKQNTLHTAYCKYKAFVSFVKFKLTFPQNSFWRTAFRISFINCFWAPRATLLYFRRRNFYAFIFHIITQPPPVIKRKYMGH